MSSRFKFFCALSLLILIIGHAQATQNASSRDWNNLAPGQTTHGIRYGEDGKLLVGSTVLTTCTAEQFQIFVSQPSSQKQLSVLLCKSITGDFDRAYVVDTNNQRSVALNPGPGVMGIWVNWSPDERHALIEMGAEDGPPHLFLLNLATNLKKEILFKDFSRRNEKQAYDADSISWITKDAFDVAVNVYTGDDKLVRTQPARVNLASLGVTYPATKTATTGQTSRLPGQTRRPAGTAPATRSSRNVSSPTNALDDCRFCGVWKAVVGGRSGRYNDMDKTGNPFCGCDYLRITKIADGKFKLSIGSEYRGVVSWTEDGDKVVINADAIYLRPLNGKLVARFVSPNFYATHAMNFTYRLTCELDNRNQLLFSVWCSIRGGETEKATYVKVAD